MTPTFRVLVSGHYRELPIAIWKGLLGPKPEHPESFICNGCTMSPDFIRGKRTWPACVIHDYHYNVGAIDRADADTIFRENLKFCLKADGMLGWLADILAWFYYRAVRRAGRSRYNGLGDPA